MPFLSHLYIRTAFLHLVLALGLAMFWTHPSVFHMLTVGWLTQLIFGVAFWLFPRVSREKPYGRTWPMVWAWGLLNAGLVLRVVAEPQAPGSVWTVLLVVAAGLQWAASLLLVVYFWKRVRVK